MWLNKRVIKIISSLLIIFTIFTFSIVLASDESIYVWSSESEPLAEDVSTEVNEENKEEENTEETEENSLNLESGSAILIEQETGKILYEHNIHEKLRPASVTKVMSILLIMEALDSGQISLEDKVPCTEDAAGMGGSQIWLEVDEELTVDEMLKAICVVSANDCTVAMADYLCGSQEAFVEKMNECAKKLKLKDTHFVNTTGIHDDNHYTTVHDMALIVQYAVANPTFKEIYSKRYATSSNGLHQWVNKSVYNAKRSNINTDSIIGCKSGYTDAAKNCLSSLDKVGDNEIIVIVGKAVNNDVKPKAAVQDTLDIVNYVGQNYSMQPILTKGTEVKNLDIGVAKDNQKILIENQNDAMAFLPNGYNQDDLEFKYTFEELEAPVKKGTKVGNLNVYYKDYLLYQEEYVSDKNIERDEMKDMYNGIINFMFPYGLAIILVIAYVMISKIKKSRRVI